jgi:hypothetical protein
MISILFWADISVRMQLPFQIFSIYLAVDFMFAETTTRMYRKYPSIVKLFFANKSLTKTVGVLEHCSEGETNFWFSIFRGVSF